ncbi:fas-binding factor 1 isoform X2 [Phyllobates terribilis]|uniref:fas-binding factor 1 isoform X2 n=1 Tax=Phyllobates terribilis TaxID=111132 RepID=UPI003CCAA26C
MASKNKTGFKDSIDDVLGDLLGDDDPSPPRPRKAPSLTMASANRNRSSVLSSAAKKSLFDDDDFYNQLAKEAAEESDVSEGDAQALLENLKDLDDMDAELFESRKPKSAPAKQAKSSDKTIGAKRGTSAPESEKKPPVGQSRPYKKFSFDEGAQDLESSLHHADGNNPLDGILSEDNNDIAKKSNPVKSSEAAIVSPTRPSPASHRKIDVNFEEDTDDIMDALGFGDHLESPHKEKSSTSRRSKFDELLGRGTSAKLLERPLTGEKKEFKLDPKYQKMAEKSDPLGDEDLAFGSYQPTMAFSPEGRPSRRSSVRFSAESNGAIKSDARSRSATPVGRSPAREEKSGADWLGLKDEDVPDLTPLRDPPRPSTVTPSSTGRPPSGTKPDARLATQIKTSQIDSLALQQDDDEWLTSSLSRNKAQKQEKLEEQKVQNRNDVKETSVGSGPVVPVNSIQQPDRGKTIQEIAPVVAEVSGAPLPWEIGVKPQSPITPTSSRQKENLVPAPSAMPSEMYRDRDKPATLQSKIQEGKKEIHSDVLHNKLLELETQIRKLQLEREQQNLLLETLQQRHKEDLELIENAHKNRLKLLEDSSRQREERLRQENQELSAQYISRSKSAEQEKADLLAQYQKKLTEFQQEKDMEIERIRELQRVSVQEMCKDHEEQLQRLKRLKDQEIDAVTSASSHTRSLNGIIEQMESFSDKLGDLSVRVRSTQVNTSQELELGARQREGQLRALQERLTRQQTDMEDERNNLRVIITNMETRLNEQSRLLEQERWRVSAEQAKVQTLQRSLEEEKRVMTQQITMEREELERAKSALLGDHKSVMTQCEEERKKLAAEWSEYHTQQKLSKERAEKDVSRAIMVESQRESAIINLAKEQAELKVQFSDLWNKEQQLTLDREALEKERQELRLEKERVNSSALRVRQRAAEVESVSKLSSQRYEDGEKALAEARKVESGHQERLRSIQGQLEYLRQREEHLHQEHINLAHQRRQLEQLRQGLPTAPSLLPNRDPEPQQIHPLSTSLLLNGLPHAVPSTTGIGSGAHQERVPQKSELNAMLAVYKVQAQQDWDYIENEKLYLEALKKSSSYPLSV